MMNHPNPISNIQFSLFRLDKNQLYRIFNFHYVNIGSLDIIQNKTIILILMKFRKVKIFVIILI